MDEDVEFTEEFTALGENKAPLNATTPQSMCLFSSWTSLTSEGNHMLQLCSTGFMVWERITLQNNDRTVLRYRSIIEKYVFVDIFFWIAQNETSLSNAEATQKFYAQLL